MPEVSDRIKLVLYGQMVADRDQFKSRCVELEKENARLAGLIARIKTGLSIQSNPYDMRTLERIESYTQESFQESTTTQTREQAISHGKTCVHHSDAQRAEIECPICLAIDLKISQNENDAKFQELQSKSTIITILTEAMANIANSEIEAWQVFRDIARDALQRADASGKGVK